MRKSQICYVIMPFDKRFDPVYKEAIRPAIWETLSEKCGESWDCRRGDDIRVPGSITREIVISLHTADLIVADLSENNPNVFYELGVAHSSARPTIMITRDINDLPFDIRQYRVHHYMETTDGLQNLRDWLSKAAFDVLSNKEQKTNPVLDFAPISRSEIILSLDDIKNIEKCVRNEVWIIEPTLDTDLKVFNGIIKTNLLERNVRYRYLLPLQTGARRQWQRFVQALGCDKHDALEARTVEPYLVESEVTIYDPYTDQEDVLIMSPREHEFLFWYRVGRTRGESIRDRFDALWENIAKPILE
jgi:hypothetical protein